MCLAWFHTQEIVFVQKHMSSLGSHTRNRFCSETFVWPGFKDTYKVRNEIETTRNETKSTKTKRNETKRNKINKNKTKRNEINEMKTK